MFINRQLEVKLLKSPKNQQTPTQPQKKDTSFNDRLWDTELVVKDILREVGKGVAAYIVLDTIRQVAITLAKK